jgi:hypothetical protein
MVESFFSATKGVRASKHIREVAFKVGAPVGSALYGLLY